MTEFQPVNLADRSMMRRILGIFVIAFTGCSSTPKPYARDPLVREARPLKGNFESARVVPPFRDAEPIPPPSPAVSGQWVNVGW